MPLKVRSHAVEQDWGPFIFPEILIGSGPDLPLAPDGTVHIHTGSAGLVSPSALADELVIEGSTHTGMSILSPDFANATLQFRHPAGYGGQIRSDPTGNEFKIQALAAASTLHLIGVNMELETSVGGLIDINSAGDDADLQIQTGTVTKFVFIDGGTNKIWIDAAGTIAVAEGTLHIHTAASGALAPSAFADEFVIEGAGQVGMTIKANSSGAGNIYFADDGSAQDASISYNFPARTFSIAVIGGTHLIMYPAEFVINEFGWDINTRIESDGNINMLVVDAGEDRVGIGVGDPHSTLEVAGAISSATLMLAAVGPTDNLDVSGVNTIFIDTSGNNVTLGGTVGGVDGQVLMIVIHDATNDCTIENAEGTGNQDFYLHAGADETLSGEMGGWVFVNMNGNHWHDASHAKHVL